MSSDLYLVLYSWWLMWLGGGFLTIFVQINLLDLLNKGVTALRKK